MVRPSLFGPSLAELAASLVRLAGKASSALGTLSGMDPQSAAVLTTGTARYGKLMLVRGTWLTWTAPRAGSNCPD